MTTDDSRSQDGMSGFESALSAIDGVEEVEWIDELRILRVTLTNGVPPSVIGRVQDVRPAGAIDTRLMGDGQHNAVVVFEYE